MSNNNQGSGTKSIDLRSRTQITFSPDLYAPLTILYSTSENSTAAYDLTKYLMSLRCGVRKVPDVEEGTLYKSNSLIFNCLNFIIC